MSFEVSDRTLRLLDWPALALRLAAHARTGRARTRVDAGQGLGRALFETDAGEAVARLVETGEARALLDAGAAPPLPGLTDPAEALALVRRGGVLGPGELLDVHALLATCHDLARFLDAHAEEAPRLAAQASALPDLRGLAAAIEAAISPDGEVRDEASPALAEARREARALTSELTRRVEALLRDREVTESLSDVFYTLRNDRFVLPVRTDARRRVPGIVHDASASGGTLFVEPEAMVEPNNRLKQAELTAEREVRRVLRELCERLGTALPEVEGGLETLVGLDLAFARGALSRELDATCPEVGDAGVFRLSQLRHPLIPPDEVVPNDLHLGDAFGVLVLSGPNAGGKTVAAKALALAVLSVRAGLHVTAAPGARVDLVEQVLADIGDAQSLADHLSTFSAHVANLAAIARRAGPHSLVVLDELGVGTDPTEGAALAQAVLESLADAGARVVTTTHFNLLKEIAAVDARFENASFEFDPGTLTPTFRLRYGAPGVSSAAALAERMGLPVEVVARARALLEGEDRQLDGLLAELAESRAGLERELAAARRAREAAEATRSELAGQLAELREGRAKVLARLRAEARASFRDAHARVAAVIRDLQRGADARAAAHARERLLAAEQELESRLPEEVGPAPPAPEEGAPDWTRLRPGDPVQVRGAGLATLVSLPDRRNRVTVQMGSARTVLPKESLAAAPRTAASRPPPVVSLPTADAGPTIPECDLRGLRADEALERVDALLDRALATGRGRVRIVHGHGTGRLREAVRSHLARAPHVRAFQPGEESEGGNGVTIALLE